MTNDSILRSARWQKLRAQFRNDCETEDAPCWICRQPIDYSHKPRRGERPSPDAFEPDHLHPRATHPELALDPANLRPSHVRCNRARGKNLVTDDLGPLSRSWTRATA